MAGSRILVLIVAAVVFHTAAAAVQSYTLADGTVVFLQTRGAIQDDPIPTDRHLTWLNELELELGSEVGAPQDLFMHYLSQHNLVVCSCAKCGSTSLYSYIYNVTFGHAWNSPSDPHDVSVAAWKGKIKHIADHGEQDKLMRNAYSFALLRDPVERLMSSWADKAACGSAYGTDTVHRPRIVAQLRALAGLPKSNDCLELAEFVDALYTIHTHGNAGRLNRHFFPQHLGPCFDRFRPEKWSQATPIGADAWKGLASHLGTDVAQPPHSNPTKAQVQVSQELLEKLRVITQDEYKMLESYLPHAQTLRKRFMGSDQHITFDLDD